MKIERMKEWIRLKMCEGRLVGKTVPVIDEPWQAGITAIKSIEAWEGLKEEIKDHAVEFELFGICSDYVSTGIIEDVIDNRMKSIFEGVVEDGEQDKDRVV